MANKEIHILILIIVATSVFQLRGNKVYPDHGLLLKEAENKYSKLLHIEHTQTHRQT